MRALLNALVDPVFSEQHESLLAVVLYVPILPLALSCRPFLPVCFLLMNCLLAGIS